MSSGFKARLAGALAGLEEVFAGARPATMLVQADVHVSTSIAEAVPNQAQFDALNAEIDSLILRRQIRTVAAADSYYYDHVLGDPGTYFVPGSTRSTDNFEYEATGSGFFVTADGYLVTAAHVVAPDKTDLQKSLVDSISPDDVKTVSQQVRQDLTTEGIPFTEAQLQTVSQWEVDYYKAQVRVDSYTKDLSTFNLTNLRAMRKVMGKYGVNPNRLAWVVSSRCPRPFIASRCSTSLDAVRAPARSDLLTTTTSAASSITIFWSCRRLP